MNEEYSEVERIVVSVVIDAEEIVDSFNNVKNVGGNMEPQVVGLMRYSK